MAENRLDLNSLSRVNLSADRGSLVDFKSISAGEIEELLKQENIIEEFRYLMMKYECALLEVKTKLDVLNKELAIRNNRNPFESIRSRIKEPVSIYEKLKRKGLDFTLDNVENELSDIAGIRVICSFVDDIYMLAECLIQQDDIELVVQKDYISSPKDSGYRSLHLIVEVPIFLTQEKEYMKVEVQFRTIAMDFWASLEHKMKYKKDIENADTIAEDLRFSADLINQLDRRMQQIRERIDADKPREELIQFPGNNIDEKNS
ncbi:MAG: GTP pyrophosphokinase family protein [Butyrivibrio sp.]|nr:GTP pyrophosphokinase family protein [Butyrivibrio sp.]